MTNTAPPRWAEWWLRSLLPERDRETVSGDLLEEYRERIRPTRSEAAANVWYLRQVSVFAWRTAVWACVLATIFISRTAYDWYVPTNNLVARARMMTFMVIAVWLVIGASSSRRTRSIGGATLTAALAATLSAILCAITGAVMYSLWHDAATRQAIAASGGLDEAFLLPVLMIVPAAAIGWTGALLASVRYGWRAR